MRPDFSVTVVNAIEALLQEQKLHVFAGVAEGADPVNGAPEIGIGYRLTPRVKPVISHRDFVEQQVLFEDAVRPGFRANVIKNNLSILIHWPTYLGRVFRREDKHSLVARRVWVHVLAWIRAEDPVLASYIETMTPELSAVATLHVKRFFERPLAKKLIAALNEALAAVWDAKQARALGKCYPCLQLDVLARQGGAELGAPSVDSGICLSCAARGAFVKQCAVISLDHVRSQTRGFDYVRSPTSYLTRPASFAGPRVARDLLWLLHGMSPHDGAVRSGNHVKAYWNHYGQRIADVVRGTGLTDALVSPVLAARTAVEADVALPFLRVILSDDPTVTPAERNQAALQLGLAAKQIIHRHVDLYDGVKTETVTREPHCTVFTLGGLRRTLGQLTSPAALKRLRAGHQNLRAVRSGTRTFRTMRVELPTPAGPVETQFRRYGERWLINVPLDMPVGVPVPRRVALQQYKYPQESTFWWTEDDLRKYINSCERSGDSNAALMLQDVADWFHAQATAYSKNPSILRETARHEARQKALENNEPGRMWFTQLETDNVREFMLNRAMPGPLNEAEWFELATRVPGRSRSGFYKVIEQLGYAYAKENGYAAYTRSGLHLKKSSRRRQAWLRKGVPLES